MTTIIQKLSYDQKDIIGRGGNGTSVFKGFYYKDFPIPGGANYDEKYTKQVAIKRIQKSYVENDETIVKHEVNLMLKVGHHPNILRYIHSEIDTHYLYIATELCRGTMEDFFNGKYDGLEKGTITKKEILRQVTKGLSHLHKLGIVHRDIKPTNILIFEPDSEASYNKPQMKLADFDISKFVKPERGDFTNTSVTNPSGTWGWIAPELYKEDRSNFKVDVWALGCIFAYTLSGGKHPYGDDDVLKRIDRIKRKRAMVLTKKDLAKDKENIQALELIKSMLMVDPRSRPTVMDILKGSFLRDEERTAKFLGLCKLFKKSITSDKINQFEELVKDETVYVNAKSNDGSTPLHYLCQYFTEDNLLHFVDQLIQNGADVNAKDVSERTPLHLLCYYYNNDNLVHVVKLLLEKGAQANVQDKLERDSPLSNLCSRYRKENMLDVVKLMIDSGANVNNETNFMVYVFSGKIRNPLCILCQNYGNENLFDIVQYLIGKGADLFCDDEYGNTPLNLLCRNYKNDNMIDIVQLLIEGGVEVNTKDTLGWTPLLSLCHHYNKNNLKDIVQLLIQNDADIKTRATDGWTPLLSLCRNYNNDNLIDIIQILIGKGADVNVKNTDGWTPFHYLCYNYKKDNLVDIVQLFNKNDTDFNAKNANGSTPLHVLCFYYKIENKIKEEANLKSLVSLFLENGAKIDAVNNKGITPYDYLIQRKISINMLFVEPTNHNIAVAVHVPNENC